MDADEAALLAELRAISAQSSRRFDADDDGEAGSDQRQRTTGDSVEEDEKSSQSRPTSTTPTWRSSPKPWMSRKVGGSGVPPGKQHLSPSVHGKNQDNDQSVSDDAVLVGEEASNGDANTRNPLAQSNDDTSIPGADKQMRSSAASSPKIPPWKHRTPLSPSPGTDPVIAILVPTPHHVKEERDGPAEQYESDQSDSAAFTSNKSASTHSMHLKETKGKTSLSESGKSERLPPWKRIGNRLQTEDDVRTGDTPVATHEVAKETGGIRSDFPSTFKGDRGGPAEDAELLALLRGVSMKYSTENRFTSSTQDEDEPQSAQSSAPRDKSKGSSATPVPSSSVIDVFDVPHTENPRSAVGPPWKRRSSHRTEAAQQDALVVAPSTAAEPSSSFGIQSDLPSTFKGDRGGKAEDAELLELLRGVSVRSSGANRFSDERNDDGTGKMTTEIFVVDGEQPLPGEARAPVALTLSNEVPSGGSSSVSLPWRKPGNKHLHTTNQQEDVAILVAPQRPPFDSLSDSSRREDALTLHTNHGEDKARVSPQQGLSNGTPPWKRRGNLPYQDANNRQQTDAFAAPPLPSSSKDDGAFHSSQHGIKSELPFTFKGDLGGSAEDPELLALLRSVSSKSSSAIRFKGEESDASNQPTFGADTTDSQKAIKIATGPADTDAGNSIVTPPWKKRSSHTKFSPERQSDESQNVPAELAFTSNRGFKSDLPSTFRGDRGGPAVDAELLALLRGVSVNTGSAGRFNEDSASELEDLPDLSSNNKSSVKASEAKSFGTPPLKRNGTHSTKKLPDDAVVAQATCDTTDVSNNRICGIKSELPSTVKGDRGGKAEDEELLALLRGISSKSSSSSRFISEGGDHDTNRYPSNLETMNNSINSCDPRKPVLGNCVLSGSDGEPTLTIVAQSANHGHGLDSLQEGSETATISREQLPTALADKNWRVRSRAYDFLSNIISDGLTETTKDGKLDSSIIMNGLDEVVVKMLEDNNAGALDKALEFALKYAQHCTGANDSNQAAKLTRSVLKNGFSSRPSTASLSAALVLKLMEVGADISSLHEVVDVLLVEGLSSKKPKVVQSTAALLLDAALEFGAASLPLASIADASPKMLSHSNAKVREYGLKLIAEICRALGSKEPIIGAINSMKKAQLSDLDAMLSSKTNADPPRSRLRCKKQDVPLSCDDALVSLQEGAKKMEAARFAARPAVELLPAVGKTEYSARVQNQKWSEKVAAIDLVLECGGEKPFKLAPHSQSNNYQSLIGDMKKLLLHTHFAVASKAMQVLAMLAEGVGEGLYCHLKPLLPTLLQLLKDKKLTQPVGNCLDSFFGNILAFDHLLENDDSIPSAVDEKNQKNALARASALEFLGRCVKRGKVAGPRGTFTASHASAITLLLVQKLDDSDAFVRKTTSSIMEVLLQSEQSEIKQETLRLVDTLEESNARAYKALSKLKGSQPRLAAARSKEAPQDQKSTSSSKVDRGGQSSLLSRSVSQGKGSEASEKKVVTSAISTVAHSSATAPLESYTDATQRVDALGIPLWNAGEDDGGILSGLQSSKWLVKQEALRSLTAHVQSGRLDAGSGSAEVVSASILSIVKEHTRGFKETNVNVMKAVLELFIAICDMLESRQCVIVDWVAIDGATICVNKLSDKKLLDLSKQLLTSLCVVSRPVLPIGKSLEVLKSIKAPAAHEEYFRWFIGFCDDFGASSIGPGISELIPYLLEEVESTNPKVRREALSLIGKFHRHLGPGFRALCFAQSKKPALRDQIEKVCNDVPFDPSTMGIDWTRKSIALAARKDAENDLSGAGMAFEVPKVDVFEKLSADIVSKLGSKDGKTAWKIRKEALDEVEAALQSFPGLIDTCSERLKQLATLMKAVRERLADTQMNLKPVAARLLGTILSLVDKVSQAKLGKLVYSPLISAAMNDVKKPMRDAALEALRVGITAATIEGGGVNVDAVEAFVGCLTVEVTESSARAGGLPDLLLFVLSIADSIPNLEGVVVTRGQTLGERYAASIVECLTSTNAETRAAALSLFEKAMQSDTIGIESVRKAAQVLKPAKQRSVAPFISRFASEKPSIASTAENAAAVATAVDTQQVSTLSKARQPGPSSGSVRRHVVGTSGRFAEGDQSAHNSSTSTFVEKASINQDKHPLVSRPGSRSSLAKTKTFVWPEYPEEPQGPSILQNLKSYWSPVLPSTSVALLFPNAGIKKQEDAKQGVELLMQALDLDISLGKKIIESQLEPILKWNTFVLCSKETTVGLTDLLNLVKKLFLYLIDTSHEFSDHEAIAIVPYLVEKASNAKGRFRDAYAEIVDIVQSEQLLSTKCLGSVVCAAILESSSHSKARVFSCQKCAECIEKVGLTGIGKKGVVATAKLLSTETLPENRAAALDLMEVILSRMNGDINRLIRICGPNFSDRARQSVSERWSRRQGPRDVPSPERRLSLSREHGFSVGGEEDQLGDELPALSLRSAGFGAPKISETAIDELNDSFADPFAFKAQPPLLLDDVRFTETTTSDSGVGSDSDLVGAAASLRARLLKIREKSKPADEINLVDVKLRMASKEKVKRFRMTPEEVFESGTVQIQVLMKRRSPVADEDPDVISCIEVLKYYHAALSKQATSNLPLPSQELLQLRGIIACNLDSTIEQLTRLVGFAFNCGNETANCGMAVPLLSVCLATLMALFRDADLSTRVSQDELANLIYETGTALLDSKLSVAAEVDEATGSQMVRAINKLAVQAATGAARHTSFLALLAIQHQLSLQSVKTSEEETFTVRLSRVIAKLFSKVIKAEESTATPFSSNSINMVALLPALEEALVRCHRTKEVSETRDACIDMVKTLLQAILKAIGGSQLRFYMGNVGLDDQSVLFGVVVSSENNLSTEVEAINRNVNERPVTSSDGYLAPVREITTPSSSVIGSDIFFEGDFPSIVSKGQDVATLVSALASSSVDAERDSALEALRAYKRQHGYEELNAYLRQVSSPFRTFIEEQLEGETSPEKQTAGVANNRMSERLRYLRSRLQATELAVQTVVESTANGGEGAEVSEVEVHSNTNAPSAKEVFSSQPEHRASRLSRPSPTKLAAPTQSRLHSMSSSQSLRERLTLAQESRLAVASGSASASLSLSSGSGEGISTSMSRAAALRARLEAVKKQSKPASSS